MLRVPSPLHLTPNWVRVYPEHRVKSNPEQEIGLFRHRKNQ